jgi:hypothetical protein
VNQATIAARRGAAHQGGEPPWTPPLGQCGEPCGFRERLMATIESRLAIAALGPDATACWQQVLALPA